MTTHEYSHRYTDPGAARHYASLHTNVFGLTNLRAMVITGVEARNLLGILKELTPIDRLLELPTGSGRMTARLGTVAQEIIGGDVARAMLESCLLTMAAPQKAQVVKRLALGEMDSGHIPLPDKSVDVVVCHRLFHQVPDSVRLPALQEMSRVARKAVVASFAVTGGIYTWRHQLRATIPIGRPEYAIPHPIHLDDLDKLMADAGLRIVKRSPTAPFVSSQMILLGEPRA